MINKKYKKSIFVVLCSLPILSTSIVIGCKTTQNQQGIYKIVDFEKENQINILSEINQFFEKHDFNEQLVQFVNKDSHNYITLDSLMKNNYAAKYVKFDKDKFKQIIKKEFNLSDAYLNKLEIEVDYTNIDRDYSNNFDIVFPIRIKRQLENHKKASYQPGLFTEQIIKFRLKNVKSSPSEAFFAEDLKDIFNKLKELKYDNFTAKNKTNVSDELKKQIDQWNINELDSTQLSNIFEINTSEFDRLKTNNPSFVFKSTIFGVDFSDKSLALNEGYLKVRFAVKEGFDSSEKSKKLIEINKEINELVVKKENLEKTNNSNSNKTEIDKLIQQINQKRIELKTIQKKALPAEAGITKLIKFKFDWNDQFWKNIKLNEVIKIDTIKYGISNTDFLSLTKDNLIVKILNKDVKNVDIKKIEKTNDFRNAKLVLDVLLKDNKKLELNKKIGVGKYSLLYENDFIKNNIQAPYFTTERLTQENLQSVNKDFFRQFDSELFSGGYASSRGFYAPKITTPIFMHIGEDYVANDFQAVLMPYDGEIIAAYELTTKIPFTGVGTVVVVKIKVSDLDWTPKEKEIYLNDNKNHIYMSFLHLDASRTLNNQKLGWSAEKVVLNNNRTIQVVKNITPEKPQKVAKNTIIGYLGNNASNGGWMSHAHVNLYTNRPSYLSENYFSTKANQGLSEDRIKQYHQIINGKETWRQFGNIGLHQSPQKTPYNIYEVDPITGVEKLDENKEKIIIKDEQALFLPNLSMSLFEKRLGYANPNLVYRLRDNKTVSFSVKEVNKLT
ncbi:MSC_0775 family lipoprotein [Mycoplasma mycoides]|uniref:MSC_0775 family lipoprotein n=1 Tax=Mycoplasma mycoides TaxID=2102 RepID=UPI00223E9E63|nr:lipoprotein [Mycoplasma mycoides]QVK06644.1 lipoprotein [Mycoplasma mycoides subsp. capri]